MVHERRGPSKQHTRSRNNAASTLLRNNAPQPSISRVVVLGNLAAVGGGDRLLRGGGWTAATDPKRQTPPPYVLVGLAPYRPHQQHFFVERTRQQVTYLRPKCALLVEGCQEGSHDAMGCR